MSIMDNTSLHSNGFESLLMRDDALEAEIRNHLRFTQSLGRVMICFLSILLCAVAFHFIAIGL